MTGQQAEVKRQLAILKDMNDWKEKALRGPPRGAR
jgi:hypothetical protein